MKRYVLLGALICPCGAHADVGDIWASPYSHTRHYKYQGYYEGTKPFRKFEDSHPSLGVEYQDAADKSISAGVYHDSYGGTSVYVARHWQYRYGVGVGTGVLAGKEYPYFFVPFLGPELTVRVMGVKATFAYMPNFGAHSPSLGVVQLAVKLN